MSLVERAKFNGLVMVGCAMFSGALMMWFSYEFMQPQEIWKWDMLMQVGSSIVGVGTLIFVLAGVISSKLR